MLEVEVRLELNYPFLIQPASRYEIWVHVLLPMELAYAEELDKMFERVTVFENLFWDDGGLMTKDEAENVCEKWGFERMSFFKSKPETTG